MVLCVDGVVKNQKEHNCMNIRDRKTNMKPNKTASCLYRGSLLREFEEVNFIDVAIASMFVLYLLTFLIYIDRYLFCMWRKPGIFRTGLWRMPARFFRPSSKVDASHSPDVRGSAQREPPMREKKGRNRRGKNNKLKCRAWCLIYLCVFESLKKWRVAEGAAAATLTIPIGLPHRAASKAARAILRSVIAEAAEKVAITSVVVIPCSSILSRQKRRRW
jgi:hypothetical protein